MVVKLNVSRTGERIRYPQRLVGLVLEGQYPTANYEHVPLRYEYRRVLIELVRVVRYAPLEEETTDRNPFLRRFGILVTGRDLDKGQSRTFYLGAFASWSMHKPTPEVLYPDLWAERVRGDVVKRFHVPDPRRFHAEMWVEDEQPECVYPVASATCRASRSCLSE